MKELGYEETLEILKDVLEKKEESHHKQNEYHREDNNGSDNYSTLLSDCGHLRKTVMPENIDTRRNNIYFKQLLVPTLSPHFCYKT